MIHSDNPEKVQKFIGKQGVRPRGRKEYTKINDSVNRPHTRTRSGGV